MFKRRMTEFRLRASASVVVWSINVLYCVNVIEDSISDWIYVVIDDGRVILFEGKRDSLLDILRE